MSTAIDELKDGLEGHDIEAMAREEIYKLHPAVRRLAMKRKNLVSRRNGILLAIDRFEKLTTRRIFSAESGVLKPDESADSEIKVHEDQTVSDVVGMEALYTTAGISKVSESGQDNLLEVNDWFSRPIVLHSDAHAIGSEIDEVINVWDAYMTQPMIRAKLKNYAYLHARMRVRISISATPFHIGRVLVSYQPFATSNPTLIGLQNYANFEAFYRPALLNYLSQAKGSTVMNVNENKPVEIDIPLIMPKPMGRLFNTDSTGVIASTTSFTDFADLGMLHMHTIGSPIEAVGTADTAIYVQVYAWLEDVKLGTSTATILQLATESGKVDERKVGPIENISSKIVRVSKALTSVAAIRPYAYASQMLFSGVGKLASLLGWSRPVMNVSSTEVYQRGITNSAITIGNDSSQRVVLDPCQELTIDPSVCASNEDEMVISYLAQRVSYVQSFVWAAADTQTDELFTCFVHPALHTSCTGSASHLMQPTAMAFAVIPFTYWRGDIVFRFEIVGSAFHRGKLLINFEPNVAQAGSLVLAPKLNKQYTHIVDIQDSTTFEITVEWAAHRPWLRVGTAEHAVAYVNNILHNNIGTNEVNGYISVFPFTQLQSPDGSAVAVNVYAYSPNLHVNGLTQANFPNERVVFEPESGVIPPSGTTIHPLNRSSATTLHLAEDCFGEQPLSFRALLKRYVTMRALPITTSTATLKTYRQTFNIIPPNNMPYQITPVTFAFKDLMSYLRYAYLGIRGGVRYIARNNLPSVLGTTQAVKMGLLAPMSSNTETLTFDATVDGYSKLEGHVICPTLTNNIAQAEFPFYTNNLWLFAPDDTLMSFAGDDFWEDVWFKQAEITIDAGTVTYTGAGGYLWLEVATGEDFSFLRFLGAPFFTIPVIP